MKSQNVIFGLLLAATFAVDALVVAWYLEVGPESRMAVLYDALMAGQLAVVCVWAVFAARRPWLAWGVAVAAVGVVGTLTARLVELSFVEACGIHGLYVALLSLTLWMLKYTPSWKRRIENASNGNWQYSLGQLLAAMTVLALVITVLRSSVLLANIGEAWKFLAILTLGDVVLAASTVFVWLCTSWLPHWWPRLGAVCFPAFVVGGLETAIAISGALGTDVAVIQSRTKFDLIAYTLIVTLVIFIWLELVPLVPHARRAASLPPAGTDAS